MDVSNSIKIITKIYPYLSAPLPPASKLWYQLGYLSRAAYVFKTHIRDKPITDYKAFRDPECRHWFVTKVIIEWTPEQRRTRDNEILRILAYFCYHGGHQQNDYRLFEYYVRTCEMTSADAFSQNSEILRGSALHNNTLFFIHILTKFGMTERKWTTGSPFILYWIIQHNNVDLLLILINNNILTKIEKVLLFHACTSGHYNIFLLLWIYFETNLSPNDSILLICQAITGGNRQIITILTASAPVIECNTTPLAKRACIKGSIDIFNQLVEAKLINRHSLLASNGIDICRKNKNFKLCLHILITFKITHLTDERLLYEACAAGNNELIIHLLTKTDLVYSNLQSHRALQCAAAEGRILTTILLYKHFNMTPTDLRKDDFKILYNACKYNHSLIIIFLLTKVQLTPSERGRAIHEAEQSNNAAPIVALIHKSMQ